MNKQGWHVYLERMLLILPQLYGIVYIMYSMGHVCEKERENYEIITEVQKPLTDDTVKL